MPLSRARTALAPILLALELSAAGALSAQPAMDALRDRIAERASRQPGALVGVYYHDMASADGLTLNADSVFHAASTMKVPVMIEYFRGIDSGRFAPGQQIQLTNRFASIVDGSPYQLDAADDSDSALYARVGGSIAVQELVERMITRSSNLATNAVIALVDARRAQATARALGATDMVVLRGVEDNLAFRAGLNNTTSARDPRGAVPGARARDGGGASLHARHARYAPAAGIQRRDPGGTPSGYAGGAQDRVDHRHSSRCRPRASGGASAVRARRVDARDS